ncbi:hypothetical protein Asppvi_005892 [Aspergillus pseudoviridinutans]|uniref:Uncharacterized protein n=1 Tax=Aspergillus pseudoviridinutans TaxID=1517512 RepID=A0A9P3EVF2_9EURO|nr:uncharacterized protein Asppvi_005892 [Aspergillus pseudoviridinutans]GIJ86993.1 hypothetical protein Asppvi_005892 [Aspergillus pseudoviridinutans]
MWGPGIASCIFRFICHIPTGMMGFDGIHIYEQAKSLGKIYDVIPQGWNFLRGLHIIGIAGVITFGWNIFQFCASPFCRGNLLGTVGLVDLILTFSLLVGLVMQHLFLPGTYGVCDGAADWKNGTDGRESVNFFIVASRSSGFESYGGLNGICHTMVQNWVISIVVIILYLICGLVNVVIGFGDERTLEWLLRVRENDSPASPRWLFSDYGFVNLALALPTAVIQAGIHTPRVGYFAFRYVCKILARTKRGGNIHLQTALLGDKDTTAQMGEFRQHTCRPICSKCLYKNHCQVRPKSGRRRRYEYNNYGRRYPNADIEMNGADVSPFQQKEVCRVCARKSPDERLRIIDSQDMLEVHRLTRLPLACDECKELLPATGVRWWIDAETGRECGWSGHPPWAMN